MSSTMLTKRRRNEISESNHDYEYNISTSLSPRSGKWTRDEERYADKLIHDFELGLLPDCAEGATLRSYLARKLNCAPMRISKKFAGKCIGKHVFSRRIGADRMMYFYEHQQQMIKQARYDDGFAYNTFDLLHHPSGVMPASFQYDDPAPSTMCANSTLSSPSLSPSNQDDFDCFCYSPKELIVDEFSRSNDTTEADEWRDVLSFFSGDIREDQQQEQVLFPQEFPDRLINSSPTYF